MRYPILFIIFLCLAGSAAYAQSSVNAHVYENKTRIALAGVMVSNLSTNEITTTNDKGLFHINAKRGDLLVLKGFEYKTDTLLLTTLRDQDIYLDPKQNELKQVDVTSTEMSKGVDFKDPEFHGQSMIYQRDEKDNLKGGVAFRVWYWKKQENKLKKEADLVKNQQTRDEIFKVFSPDNIGQYIPLKGQEMDAFIIRYIPDVKVYASPTFNLLVYLNSSYKEFNTLSPEERKPQKLD